MSNLIFIKDNDNNVGIGSNMINDIKGNINITQNLNVSGNLNVTNGEMIKTTGIGSFGSIHCGVGTFTSIDSGSGAFTTLTLTNKLTVANGGSPWTTSGSDIYRTSGKVGINKTSPSAFLHVGLGSYSITNSGGFYGPEHHTYTDSSTNRGFICAKFDSVVAADSYIAFSDRRIKTNIMDVPDNLALQQLRNIPCRYYEYIDKVQQGSNKTIGFIAQEVKTIMPMATIETQNIIPNVYKIINCVWTSVDNKFNMSSSDLPNVSGITYQFYVSNTSDYSDEKEIILTGNGDNTFTFDTQYTNVFCYGSEVDDFHTIDKAKLFALNFSATQELDRIQQTHITEITSLKTEVSTLKTENQEQQNEINTLKTEVSTLKTENATLKSVIDKLKTANSFEEFKQTL